MKRVFTNENNYRTFRISFVCLKKNLSRYFKYIESLSKFYKIATITIEKDKLDISSLSNNYILQIIPNKKENKFDKEKYTLLQISS